MIEASSSVTSMREARRSRGATHHRYQIRGCVARLRTLAGTGPDAPDLAPSSASC
jgi:hypothetical protein